MQIEQCRLSAAGEWSPGVPGGLRSADLVLAFGAAEMLRQADLCAQVRSAYTRAHCIGCSTAGEICSSHVSDGALVVTAIAFESSRVEGASINIGEGGDSALAGERLAGCLDPRGLVHAFVISDGLRINGSELVRGLTAGLPADVAVTGGLSGDGERFAETLVFWDGEPKSGEIAIVGLYGERLRVGYGSLGGWDPFGPERLITRAEGNVLYELDGRSALELYKVYLGEHAKGLPATGLLFPLSLRAHEHDSPVVRTILSVDEARQSLTFAGDVPEGAYARLMKANFDRLIDGAAGAARTSYEAIGSVSPDLAILVSCVGRKLVLKQRVEEEVEGVRDVMGEKAVLTGFYSYGEISPLTPHARCELHNQTMTITTLSER